MRPPYQKEVLPNELVPGEIYDGYVTLENGHQISHFCQVRVAEDGAITVYGHPIEEEVLYYTRPLTWQEEKEWYEKASMNLTPRDQLNLIGIHTDLYGIGDARHEMWNGWIEVTWQEQVIKLREEDFFIVGLVDPAPARVGLPMRHAIAVVIEYDDGARYWCHAEKDWFDDMREESIEQYKKLGG